MMNKCIPLSFVLLFCVVLNGLAQTNGKDFKLVDAYVKKLGSLDSMNMGTISAIVTKPFTDKTDKARAIFDWIAYNISYDCKAGRSGNTQKNTPTEVLLYRKAVGIGYAALFQDMCSSANIRCLIPDGYAKMNPEQIEDSKTDINHSWAVVQLGQSPDDWFYVDPAWGSGFTDADMKVYTPFYNDVYFFADKPIFNWQHYPDNEAWKLGAAPKNKKDFYALPLIRAMAYELGLKKFTPGTGKLKVKAGQPSSFSFTVDLKANISKISLRIGELKKQKLKDVPFAFDKGQLSFSFKFEEGDYPVTIEVNGKGLAVYAVEAD